MPTVSPQTDQLGGRPLGDEWNIAFHVSFTFEVPASLVEPVLPAGVEAMETVPGRALLNVIHARYEPGTLGEPASFDEVVCSVLAQPDLSVDMPAPRLTLAVLDVLSNSEAFVAHKVPALRMPVRFDPGLASEVDADGLGTRVWNDDGPLFRLRCTGVPRFRSKAFFGQYFACVDGRLHHSVWSWWGELHETQRERRQAGEVHAHPFFARIGLGALEARDCWLQQVSAPGGSVHMRTFQPREIATSGG
ncbi:MAG: hypothetical protein H6737_14475 [Alphaproteobacteria bacterium]|nr:hypothetical protein [Alphaproteobacteria bacterium]